MKIVKFILAMVLTLGMTQAFAYNNELEDIVLNVSVNREVAPDLAFIHYSIVGNGDRPEAATKMAAEKKAAVQDALQKMGVESQNIEEESYNLYPVYDNKQKISAYRAFHSLKIKTEQLENIGCIIDILTKNGTDSIGSVEYTLKDKNFYQDELLKDAVKNAQNKAEVVAKAAGRKVGRLLSARLNSFSTQRSMTNGVMLAKGASAGADGTRMENKNIVVSANLEAVFALK